MARARTYTCAVPGCDQPRYKSYYRCEAHSKAYWRKTAGLDETDSVVVVGFQCPNCGARRVRINAQPTAPCWSCGASDVPPSKRGRKKRESAAVVQITPVADATPEVDEITVQRIDRMLRNMVHSDAYTDGTLTVALLLKAAGAGRVATRRFVLLRGDIVLESQVTALTLLTHGWQHGNVQATRLTPLQHASARGSTTSTVAEFERKRA